MTIRVFASGQSNCLGRGTGGPDWSTIDSRVRVWDNANPLGANGSAWRASAVARSTYGTFENTDRGNFGVWFSHKLAQTLGEDVDMTIVARGATTISGWAPGNAVGMLQECIDVWTATGQAPANVFLWHQGEGNVSQNPTSLANYRAAFLNLVANLKVAGVIDDDTIIIVGGTAEENADRIAFNVGALQVLATENDAIQYAPSDGLPTYDGTHFTGDALYSLGVQGYFAAYLQAEGLGMTDIWTLVNEGGTPGVTPSGAPKIFNLKSLRAIGLGVKDTSLAADFAGIPPGDKLLTAAMVAAGAVVDWGTGSSGTYWRFESGLQVCAINTAMTYSSGTTLQITWTYPKPFSANPFVVHVPVSSGDVNMTSAKQAGACPDLVAGPITATLRLKSNGLYVSGDARGTSAIAIGMWK